MYFKVLLQTFGFLLQEGGHDAQVNDLCWCENDKILYTCSNDKHITEWDTKDCEVKRFVNGFFPTRLQLFKELTAQYPMHCINHFWSLDNSKGFGCTYPTDSASSARQHYSKLILDVNSCDKVRIVGCNKMPTDGQMDDVCLVFFKLHFVICKCQNFFEIKNLLIRFFGIQLPWKINLGRIAHCVIFLYLFLTANGKLINIE